MKCEWKKCTLADIGTIVGGATPSTKCAENYGGDIPWITPKDLSSFSERYIEHGERNITASGLASCSAQMLPTHSILFSSRAPIGYVAIAANEMCTNQGFKSVVPNKNVDYLFLYYLLKYNKDKIEALGSGTTFKEVSGKTMKSIEVTVPSDIAEQRKISSVLGALDDKIELNNKINANLQQQAQAIFKSWFVDFEPFGGEKPALWTETPLGNYIEIKRGGSPRPIQDYLAESGLRWLKISDATSIASPFILTIKEHIKKEGLRKTVFLNAGSLVLSNSATPGIPKILDVDSCIHDGWLYFPKSIFSKYYLYLLFKQIRGKLLSLGNGSIFTNLKTDILREFEVLKPDNNTLSDFDDIIKPLFNTMLIADRETQHLKKIRDELLPKLMSGKIDISEINI